MNPISTTFSPRPPRAIKRIFSCLFAQGKTVTRPSSRIGPIKCARPRKSATKPSAFEVAKRKSAKASQRVRPGSLWAITRRAKPAAKLFTLTKTCNRLHIDPFAYLQDVYARLPTTVAG